MSLTNWILWAFILIAQNFAFTFVSRARNSGSLKRHLIAGVFSNGVWFISQTIIFTAMFAMMTGKFGTKMAIFTGLYYTVFTLTGSVLAHHFSLKTEKGKSAVGATKKYAQIPVSEWERVRKAVGMEAILYDQFLSVLVEKLPQALEYLSKQSHVMKFTPHFVSTLAPEDPNVERIETRTFPALPSAGVSLEKAAWKQ